MWIASSPGSRRPDSALPGDAGMADLGVGAFSPHLSLLAPDISGVPDRSTLSPASRALSRSGLGCVHDVCVGA